MGLLLPDLTQNPLAERWLGFVAKNLEKLGCPPLLIGKWQSSSYPVRANFISYIIAERAFSQQRLKFWHLRNEKFTDFFWEWAGCLIRGPNLNHLAPRIVSLISESKSINGGERLSSHNPLFWPWRREKLKVQKNHLRLVIQGPVSRSKLENALNLIFSLDREIKVRVPGPVMEKLELSGQNVIPEDRTDYRRLSCEFVWPWGYSPSLHLRCLDWLSSSVLIAPRCKPWQNLVGSRNRDLLFPPGRQKFGVEVLDRLLFRRDERKEIINQNKEYQEKVVVPKQEIELKLKEIIS